jgi:phosphoesterase RecJ-like protein
MSSLPKDSFSDIAKAIESAQRIAIAGHIRPDGDAVGSTLALGSSLRAAGKDVVVMNEDAVPDTLNFLPEQNIVQRAADVSGDFDLAIALDTANKSRLGETVIAKMSTASQWINIDHHISNEVYGALNHIDTESPATGQIIFELITSAGFPLTNAARDSLYVAISTDTGSFQYPATTARTYEIGAALIRAGTNIGDLNSKTYDTFSYRRIELLRELLQVIQLTSNGRVASWAMTMEMKDRLNIRPDDSETLIHNLRGIEGVIVAVFFEELRDGSNRISMRSKSKDIADVCRICQHFGGGGHSLAAGARTEGELITTQESVLRKIHEVIEYGKY